MGVNNGLAICGLAAGALAFTAVLVSALPSQRAGRPAFAEFRASDRMCCLDSAPDEVAASDPNFLDGSALRRSGGLQTAALDPERSADLDYSVLPSQAPRSEPRSEPPRLATGAIDPRVKELQDQLRERDAEIARLRGQLGRAESVAGAESKKPTGSVPSLSLASTVDAPAGTEPKKAEDETRALERALVKQGGSVVPQGAVEIEPEVDFLYSEPAGGRRDTFVTSLNIRYGLPWDAQAELSVPYVAYDRQTGSRIISNVGDVQLGLTKQLFREGEFVPELLVTGRWKSRSGHSLTTPATGTGSDTLQAAVTAIKRQDPIVLFTSVGYTASLGTGRADIGSTVGGKFGAFLAATPETTVFADVDVNSTLVNRIALVGSNRLVGVFEMGAATVLSRATLLNFSGGLGFTRQAPDFRFSVSLPTRF